MAEGAATRFQLCALLILFSNTTVFCQSISTSSLWGNKFSSNTNNNRAALFVFGDSLYDPGNNNYITTNTELQANFWPYGESFFTEPTGRFSDGRLIPDFICEYAGLPIIPPYLQPGKHHFVYGANFASGGAGALDETFSGLVVNLNTQLNQFKNVANHLKQQLGHEEASDLLSQSVYMISIGVNDYRSLTRGDSQQSYTQEQYRSMMIIGNLTSVIKAIYKTGGRKFSFVTLPPLGCWPSIKASNAANKTSSGDLCNKNLASLVQEHSKAVSEKLEKLEKALKGFKYSVFDFHTCFNDRMTNPSKYGFKNGDSACCGSGPYRGFNSCGGMRGIKEYELCENAREYLFFDSDHPSEVANQQLAKLMWEGSSSVTGPYNIRSFFQLSKTELS